MKNTWTEWFSLRENNQAETMVSDILQQIPGIHSTHIEGGQYNASWNRMDDQLRQLTRFDRAANTLVNLWNQVKYQTNEAWKQARMYGGANGRQLDHKSYNAAIEPIWAQFRQTAQGMLQRMRTGGGA